MPQSSVDNPVLAQVTVKSSPLSTSVMSYSSPVSSTTSLVLRMRTCTLVMSVLPEWLQVPSKSGVVSSILPVGSSDSVIVPTWSGVIANSAAAISAPTSATVNVRLPVAPAVAIVCV